MLAQIEYNTDERRIDHVWITLEVPRIGSMRAAINTLSRLNRDAGFDSRVRAGIVRRTYEELPESGIFACQRFDYTEIEKAENVFYEHHDRAAMETLLTTRANEAILVEVWGDIYSHSHVGVHQVHSRRASCAILRDTVGRDGALKFYYEAGKGVRIVTFQILRTTLENDESRMTNDEELTELITPATSAASYCPFGLHACLVIRHSSFVILNTMRILRYDEPNFRESLSHLQRHAAPSAKVEKTVRDIIAKVRKQGRPRLAATRREV